MPESEVQPEAPACAKCGYDRSGLPDSHGAITPCPECGGTLIATPWQGWWKVFTGAIFPAWIGATVLVALPSILTRLNEPSPLLAIWLGGGALTTLVLIAFAPWYASEYGGVRHIGLERPGKLQLALAGFGFAAIGSIVIVGVTAAILPLL